MAYKKKDLEKFQKVIQIAQDLWKAKTVAYVKEHGDKGSAVIGDGIFVDYIPPGCRKPRPLKIVSPAGAQGCGNYEQFKDEIIKYLKDSGLNCYYLYGTMD